jgi:hypothetical protein
MAVISAPPVPSGTAVRGANPIPDSGLVTAGRPPVLNRPLIAVQTAFAPPASVGYAS